MPNNAISPSIIIWQVSAKDKSEYPKDYIERYLKDDSNNWTDLNFDHANDGMCLKLEEEILYNISNYKIVCFNPFKLKGINKNRNTEFYVFKLDSKLFWKPLTFINNA